MVGCVDGLQVGLFVAFIDGKGVGSFVGFKLGRLEGLDDGCDVGCAIGILVGMAGVQINRKLNIFNYAKYRCNEIEIKFNKN